MATRTRRTRKDDPGRRGGQAGRAPAGKRGDQPARRRRRGRGRRRRRRVPPGGLTLAQYREVLHRFWELANRPAEAAKYGIDVAQGQAVFTEYQVGRYYAIYVEADGGLTIRPELLWLE